MPKERFKKGRIARGCWVCGVPIQFLPTDRAPLGAWVDAGTDRHHRHTVKADVAENIEPIQQIIEFRDCRIVIVDEPQDLPPQDFIDSLNATTEDGWKPWSARISERGRVVMERSR